MRRLLSLCALSAAALTLTLAPAASAVTCYGTVVSIAGEPADLRFCPTP